MARSRSRKPKEPKDLDPEADGEVEPGTIDDPEAYEAAKAAGTIKELDAKPSSGPTSERQKRLPDRTIKLTAKRCLLARSRDPIVAAFLHTEGLRKSIRKLTREEWDAELEAFKSAPR